MLALVLLISLGSGKQAARERINQLITEDCVFKENGWNDYHQVIERDTILREGYIVAKSGADIAMFNVEEKQLKYIKLSAEAVLKRQYQPPSSDE